MDYANDTAYRGFVSGWNELGTLRYGLGIGYYQSAAQGWPNGPSMFYAHENEVGADPIPSLMFADGHGAATNVIEVLEEAGHNPKSGAVADLRTAGTIFDALD